MKEQRDATGRRPGEIRRGRRTRAELVNVVNNVLVTVTLYALSLTVQSGVSDI